MKKLSQFKEGLNSYKDISFYLKRKSKKNLNIRINAKNEIEVSIPPKAKDDLLIEFLDANLEKFHKYSIEKNNNNWINLEEEWFYLFGIKIYYVLDLEKQKIIINNNGIVKLNFLGKEKIIEQINKYRQKLLFSYLEKSQKNFEKLMNIPEHEIKIRNKNTAWATNHIQKKIIYYSINLASFSTDIIDYVIIHELSHHHYNNHSQNFWSYVRQHDPLCDTKKYKLKKYIYY